MSQTQGIFVFTGLTSLFFNQCAVSIDVTIQKIRFLEYYFHDWIQKKQSKLTHLNNAVAYSIILNILVWYIFPLDACARFFADLEQRFRPFWSELRIEQRPFFSIVFVC